MPTFKSWQIGRRRYWTGSDSESDVSTLITAQIPANLYASERAAVKERIRDLLRKLNRLTPVGRLSPELLVEIFSYLQNEWWSTPALLKITHVSHCWRVAALNCSALWAEINFYNKNYVSEWLKRSRSSNLYISMDIPRDEGAFQLTLSHLHRIRELRLEVVNPADNFPQFPDVCAAALSTLTIECSDFSSTFSLPLLSRSFPALSVLSLKSCGRVDLTATGFTDLTSLRVEDSSITATVPALLDLLETMPRLKDLALHAVLLSRSPLPKSLPIVELSALRRFVYRGSDSEADLALLLLSQLRLTKCSPHAWLNIEASLRTQQTFPTQSLMFDAIKNVLTTTTGLYLGFGSDQLTISQTLFPRIKITGPNITVIYDGYISWMLRNLSLFTELRYINISGTIPPNFWPVLKKMDALETIDIYSDQIGSFFNLFIEDWRKRKPSSATWSVTPMQPKHRPGLIFPNLHMLSAKQFDFQSIPDCFLDVLKHCRDCGNGLMSFVIKSCSNVQEEWIEQLEEIVEYVGVYEDSEYPWLDEEEEEQESDGSGEDEDEDEEPITWCEGCGRVLLCDFCN
ncbi:hypothetical protein BDN72DRAFT_960136 [Pluteus cervinus]|uniref:Uncharacterized protein n=1 Tax=Pluteus cervinus TaxID=181527 RepID=A0ACD3ATS6_9AGAR|nr:hypothetical protein BDN72DRAFT_960136 [Pluteus cervinus]